LEMRAHPMPLDDHADSILAWLSSANLMPLPELQRLCVRRRPSTTGAR